MSAQKAEPSRVAKMAFNGGELSPYLRGRLDLARLYTGAKELTNFMTLPQGPMTRRAGTVFQAKLEPPVPVSIFTPVVDTAYGPEKEDEGEENNFHYLWTLRETNPDTEPEAYPFVYGNGVEPDASAEEYILEDDDPDQFSISFDSTGTPIIGFVENGEITLRKKSSGIITTYTAFDGTSIQLWNSGILLDYISDSDKRDAIVYYLKENEQKIFHRLQSDNFAIEYESTSELSFKPEKLLNEFVAGFDLYMRTLSEKGAVYTVHIKRYIPFLFEKEQISFSGGFFGTGEYVQVIREIPEVDEQMGMTGGFVSGEYKDLIVHTNLEYQLGMTGAFVTGAYNEVIKILSAEDQLGVTGSFLDGTYLEVVVASNQSDDLGFTGGFISGTYTAI